MAVSSLFTLEVDLDLAPIVEQLPLMEIDGWFDFKCVVKFPAELLDILTVMVFCPD